MSGQLFDIPNVLTPTKSKNLDIFGRYTNAAYQNANLLYATDNSFFTFAPRNLLPFYWNVVMPNLYWYRGFYPGIHNNGIYATCLAKALCKKVANMTYSGGFRFEGENPEYVDYLNDFIIHDRTAWKLKRALPMNNATGSTLVNLDIDLKGQRHIRFTDGNRFYVQTDEEGAIIAYRRYLRCVTPDIDKELSSSTNGYFLIQDRWIEDGHCYEIYRLYQAPAIATSGAVTKGKEIEIKTLTKEALEALESANVPTEKINKCYQLPFDEIGARIILCSKSASGFEDYPFISDPLLNECHTLLREYDEVYSDKNLDRILAAKGVIVPKNMSPADLGIDVKSGNGAFLNYEFFKNSTSNLNGHIYEKNDTFNPDKDEPFFYQSDMRADVYNADLDGIVGKIADRIFISSSDLGNANSTDVGGGKTAYEVATITGISKVTIDDKREFITEAMEYIFRLILKLEYGDDCAKCSMVFNSDTAANPTQELDDTIKQLQNGLIDKKTAIKKINPNLSDEEVEKLMQSIEAEQQQAQQQEMQNQMNMYGQFDNYKPNEQPQNDGELNEQPSNQFQEQQPNNL